MAARRRSSPAGEGDSREFSMNGGEESDGVVVPMKSSNKAKEQQAGAAEEIEGSTLAKKVARSDIIAVRYADDLVVGFQHRTEAERFLGEFQERLAKFELEVN